MIDTPLAGLDATAFASMLACRGIYMRASTVGPVFNYARYAGIITLEALIGDALDALAAQERER